MTFVQRRTVGFALFVVLIGLLPLVGCSDDSTAPDEKGTVSGTVSFTGTWPATSASDHAPVWATLPWPPPTTATPRPVAFLPTIGQSQ